MSNRKPTSDPTVTRDARFNQLQVERFRSDPRMALEHSNSRNARVAEFGCILSLLRSTGKCTGAALVQLDTTILQNFSSGDGYQAAHFLPGQIQIDHRHPWTLIDDRATRVNIERLFADVEHLPPNFNKADSAAENNGLKESFRSFCEQVIRDPQPMNNATINRAWVKYVYQKSWCSSAGRAFELAIEQKEQKPLRPLLQRDGHGNLLNLDELTGTADMWNTEEQVRILRRYIESLHTWPVSLEEYRMKDLESSFRR